MIGDFANRGQTWRRQAEEVLIHDFPSDGLGAAKPYGIYDLRHQQGYVYVGRSADTPEFAPYCVAQWWSNLGRPRFARKDRLLIFCDAGGSNNVRFWLWKQEVQSQLANQFGIQVMICHYPTGNSKYNPIEYRLFSPISLNWAGKPLRSFQIMLNFIGGTTNKTGCSSKHFSWSASLSQVAPFPRQNGKRFILLADPFVPTGITSPASNLFLPVEIKLICERLLSGRNCVLQQKLANYSLALLQASC